MARHLSDGARNAGARTLQVTDPQRVQLTLAPRPFARKIRGCIRRYINHSDDYTAMQDNGKQNNIDVVSFATECPTHWGTTLTL